MANLYLMANEEEVTSETCDYTFDELQDVFSELLDDFKKLKLKRKELKKHLNEVINENVLCNE